MYDYGSLANDELFDSLNAEVERLRAVQSDLIGALQAVVRNDSSDTYEYGEPRRDGTKPEAGARWNTPREIAMDALTHALQGSDT